LIQIGEPTNPKAFRFEYPGGRKRLFADGTIPAAFEVKESTVTSKGVIIMNYERAGKGTMCAAS
jgi:hypothetical protein